MIVGMPHVMKCCALQYYKKNQCKCRKPL